MTSSGKGTCSITPDEVLDTPIDYTTSLGWKQWEESIKKLSNELYDGSLEKIRMFIKKPKYWATAAGWISICEINGKSLFQEYGKTTQEECIDSAKRYYILETSGKLKETQDAQMS